MTDPRDPADLDLDVDSASADPSVIDPADAALLVELGHAAAAHDPVPPSVVAAARAAFTWRTIDAELAELVFDSAVEATGVRGMAWPRQLSFEGRETSIEVEVTDDRLVGQVVPPASIEVVLTTPDGTEQVTRSDPSGHFSFPEVAAGTVRLAAVRPDGTVSTQWFTLG